jgi:starch synthase (maltosyl-transferring)
VQPLQTRIERAPAADWPDTPVPVALVITELDVGGAEKMLVELARRLDRRRWSPTVLALGPDAPLASPLRQAGMDVACLGVDARRPVRAVLRLAAALRARRPRLVQSFLFHANIASRLACALAGKPWVLGGVRVAEHDQAWHLRLERRTQRLGTGSVCVSEGVRRWMIEKAGIAPERLFVIPNGVDLAAAEVEQAPRSVLAARRDGPIALYVGRLTRQKGVDVLIEAAVRVTAERPDWSLAIVGDGPDRGALASAVEQQPSLRAAVRFLGQRNDVPALLKAADVIVLPSRWEGMPNIILEAMAAARPVVATAVEGSVELVRAGETGWLVPPDDAPALAGAVLESAADPECNQRFGRAGRAFVERSFSLDAMTLRYEQLWARVLGLACPADAPFPCEPTNHSPQSTPFGPG